jgi:hypothetical protein
MLTFISANVPNPGLLVFFIVVACGALTFAWTRLHHSKEAPTAAPSTVTYRGVRLRMHPSVPTGKIVVLDPSGYTLTQMTMQMLDGLSRHSGAAVLLSRRDFDALMTRVRGLAWRATARDIINF